MTTDEIIDYVCQEMGVSFDNIISHKRNRPFVIARMTAMYLIKCSTTLSLKSIGRLFEKRDHSTVIHAITSVNDMLDTDPVFISEFMPIYDHVNLMCNWRLPELNFKRPKPTERLRYFSFLNVCEI